MAKRSILWKFFNSIEHKKDSKKIKQAECTLCPDTIPTCAGGTLCSVKHLVEYSKAKNSKAYEYDKATFRNL